MLTYSYNEIKKNRDVNFNNIKDLKDLSSNTSNIKPVKNFTNKSLSKFEKIRY